MTKVKMLLILCGLTGLTTYVSAQQNGETNGYFPYDALITIEKPVKTPPAPFTGGEWELQGKKEEQNSVFDTPNSPINYISSDLETLIPRFIELIEGISNNKFLMSRTEFNELVGNNGILEAIKLKAIKLEDNNISVATDGIFFAVFRANQHSFPSTFSVSDDTFVGTRVSLVSEAALSYLYGPKAVTTSITEFKSNVAKPYLQAVK